MRAGIPLPDTLAFVAKASGEGQKYDKAYAAFASAEIRRFMLDHDLTQGAAGARLGGVSQTAVAKYLDGSQQPGLRVLIALREELRRPLDDLLGLPALPGGNRTEGGALNEKLNAILREVRELRELMKPTTASARDEVLATDATDTSAAVPQPKAGSAKTTRGRQKKFRR